MPVTKSGSPTAPDAQIEIKDKITYASRGGFKLSAAFDAFGCTVVGNVCADVGCSTGGFTDVLVKRGAAKVYAIDVGYGDLAWDLRTSDRVVVMERTNATQLSALPEEVDFISIDVSLLSLRKVLPNVKKWLRGRGEIVALVKPQYEASSDQLPEGAVIEDPKVHDTILQGLLEFCETEKLYPHGLIPSPILGMGGNKEFLVWLTQNKSSVEISKLVSNLVKLAT